MSKTSPSERDIPYFELGPVRLFFDGSHNWIVEELVEREPEDGENYTEWAERRFYPDPKTALQRAAKKLLERDTSISSAEEMLEALHRTQETINQAVECFDRPDLENVSAYELPLPHRQ